MPIYEYKCRQCGHQPEVIEPITARPLAVCPKCQSSEFTRILFPSFIDFRGTGWTPKSN